MPLRDYEKHPRTVVLSTHLINESASLLDRVVILDEGKVIVDNETERARDSVVVLSGQSDAVHGEPDHDFLELKGAKAS